MADDKQKDVNNENKVEQTEKVEEKSYTLIEENSAEDKPSFNKGTLIFLIILFVIILGVTIFLAVYPGFKDTGKDGLCEGDGQTCPLSLLFTLLRG